MCTGGQRRRTRVVRRLTLFSIHLYTGFGPRDRSLVEREYGRSVYGPDAAEYSIEVCKGLINKAVSCMFSSLGVRTKGSVAVRERREQAGQDRI